MSAPATLAPPPADPAATVAYHRYRGPVDLSGMMEANRRLRTLCGILEPIDMPAIEHRYTHLVNSDPLVDCIVATRDGETVGYARTEWHNLVDGDRMYDHTLVVAPDAWGLGISDALLRWSEARCRQIAAGHTDGRRGWLSTFLFDGDDEARGAFERHGYELVRLGADMLRPDMEAIPAVVVPDGYVLRTPEQDELPAVHLMNVEAFADHWGEPEEEGEATLGEWIDDPRFRRDLVAVLWQRDQPAAVVGGMLETMDDGTLRGYVATVGTHPAHRRRGLARAGLIEVLRRLRDVGATSAYLGVDAQNANRAFALYEDLGFRKAAGSTAWRKPIGDREDTV